MVALLAILIVVFIIWTWARYRGEREEDARKERLAAEIDARRQETENSRLASVDRAEAVERERSRVTAADILKAPTKLVHRLRKTPAKKK